MVGLVFLFWVFWGLRDVGLGFCGGLDRGGFLGVILVFFDFLFWFGWGLWVGGVLGCWGGFWEGVVGGCFILFVFILDVRVLFLGRFVVNIFEGRFDCWIFFFFWFGDKFWVCWGILSVDELGWGGGLVVIWLLGESFFWWVVFFWVSFWFWEGVRFWFLGIFVWICILERCFVIWLFVCSFVKRFGDGIRCVGILEGVFLLEGVFVLI